MSATKKWLDIFVDILAYEAAHATDGELLSEACDRWIEKNPVTARAVILAAGTALTLHLSNSITWQFDVISRKFWARNFRLWKTLTVSA